MISEKVRKAFEAESWKLEEDEKGIATFSCMNGIDPVGLTFRTEAEAKQWLKTIAPIRRMQVKNNYGIVIGQEPWRKNK